MSELQVNKISPRSGAAITLGDSGDTFTIPSGATIVNSGTATGFGGGKVVQVVNTTTSAIATGTTQIPVDDTIPQNTEGTEFMTLAITPTSASNKLIVSVEAELAYSFLSTIVSLVLFQDSTANALAITSETLGGGANWFMTHSMAHYMTAGTTSATTFKVRAGGHQAGTITFNGSAGNRLYGGVANSSITITEISA